MPRCAAICRPILLLAAVAALAGCHAGPSVNGSFARTFAVTGHTRIELTNASGDVDITEGPAGTVSVNAEVRASGFGFDNPQRRLNDIVSNPPIEQRGDTIRIGKEMTRMHHVTIAYTVRVPHDTEVEVSVASGAQTIRGVRGPVKLQAASGAIRVDKIERGAQLRTASGSIEARDMGEDVRVSTASGNVDVANIKGDVNASAISGVIQVAKSGGRVEANTASGSVEIQDAENDVKARAASGRVSVQGNPAANAYWELRTASGGVKLKVPASANFHLSAEAVSGEIRADLPIIVEEQSKHALRAHVGNGGGRIDVHTVSGEIRISGAN